MAYSGAFNSFYDDDYDVYVGGQGSGLLTFSSEPIVTQEDDSDDMFTPIRLQSGYLNIIDTTGSQWSSLMPTSATERPVTLYKHQDVVWRGFLSPESYGAEYNVKPQEFQIPLVCMLTVLESFRLPVTPPSSLGNTPTFKQLLEYVIAEVASSAGWTVNVYYQGVTQTFNNDRIGLKVQWGALIEEDGDGNLQARWNNLELVENICQFLGLTARTWHGDVYFTCADDYNNIDQAPQYDVHNSSFPFMNTNNSVKLLQGTGRVKVMSNIDKPNEYLSAPFEKILEKNISHTATDTSYGSGLTGKIYTLNNVAQSYTFGFVTMSAAGDMSIVGVEYIDNPPSGTIDHNWSIRLRQVSRSGQYPTTGTKATIKTTRQFHFSYGKLVISGNVFYDKIEDGKHTTAGKTGLIRARLLVGNYCWSGSLRRWVVYDPDDVAYADSYEFNIEVKNGNIGEGLWTDVFNNGMELPCPQNLTGKIQFDILDLRYASYSITDAINLDNLSITYSRGNYRKESSTKIVKTNNMRFSNEVSKDLEFSSDFELSDYGFGLVLTSNGTYYKDIGAGRPEEALAQRILTFESSVKKVLSIEISDEGSAADISPFYDVISPKSETYYPMVISNKWRDNILVLKLIKT